jgi:hypothetical protein
LPGVDKNIYAGIDIFHVTVVYKNGLINTVRKITAGDEPRGLIKLPWRADVTRKNNW